MGLVSGFFKRTRVVGFFRKVQAVFPWAYKNLFGENVGGWDCLGWSNIVHFRGSVVGKVLFINIYNHGHNILRLFNVLPNFLFIPSKMKCDYW